MELNRDVHIEEIRHRVSNHLKYLLRLICHLQSGSSQNWTVQTTANERSFNNKVDGPKRRKWTVQEIEKDRFIRVKGGGLKD